MRHVHFVPSIDISTGGGLGQAALSLHMAMVRSGAASVLLTTGPRTEADDETRVMRLRRIGPERIAFAPGMRTAGDQLLEDGAVLHGHGFFVHPNFALPRIARRRNLPFVYHPHGMLEPWVLRQSRMRKAAARIAFENANTAAAAMWRALTVTEEKQIRALGVDAPIAVVPNGVDLDMVRERPEGGRRDDGRRVLLFMGRLHPKKGLPLVVTAWDALRSMLTDWELVIAGPDERGHRQELESLVSQLDLASLVRFVGPVRGPEKWALLASADAFVLTSHSEGFPVSAIEAMASRVPLLITRGANVRGVASRGAGFECDDSAMSVQSALRDLLETDAPALAQMGDNARAWVEEDFTWATIAARFIAACDEVLV